MADYLTSWLARNLQRTVMFTALAIVGLMLASLVSQPSPVVPSAFAGGKSAKSKKRKCKKRPKHKCKKRGRHPQAYKPGLRHVPTVKVPFGGRGGTADPGNDYPAVWRNAPQDSMLDNWREYNRECTSFVAWALSSRNGFNMPFYDNANGWGPKARARGFAVNSTPAPGSVAWSNAGTYGHVAYVQDVIGSSVHIEEYNYAGTGQYSSRVVSSSAFTGYIHFKDRAAQAPPSSPAAPQTGPIDSLGFVKTKDTGGTVEVHWDTLQGGAYKRVVSSASDFSPGEAKYGHFQLFGSANGAPQLGFIKTKNTGGTVEVHWDNLSGGSYKRAGSFVSDFSPADASNGVWELFGSANGAPQLGFIKTKNTGGTVEVHWDNLSGGSYKRAGSFVSDFSPADASNGVWELFGSANGAPQLGFIKTKHTGGTIEVHWDNLQGGYYRRIGDYVSDFTSADADNGSWNLYGSGNPVLGFVKFEDTGSGKVEGHSDTLQGSAYKRSADYASEFLAGDGPNGNWQIGLP